MRISKISIVIPTYNSGFILKKCVDSIIRNTHNIKYEIIIVDDCSNDDSTKFLKDKFIYKSKVKFFKLKNNKGVGYCRDFGARKSKCDYIVYVDADLLIKKNSIKFLIESFEKNKIMVGSVGATPNFKNLNKKNFSSNFVFLRSVYGIFDLKKDNFSSNVQSEFCLIKKSFLLKIGSWKAYKKSGGEEFELGYRIEQNNKKNVLSFRAKYDTYYADIILRFKKMIRRTEVYIPILLNKKKFDSKGSSATRKFALSTLMTLLIIIMLFSLIFFPIFEIKIILSVLFLVYVLIEYKFLYFVWQKKKNLIIYSLIGITILNFAIIIGSTRFLIKSFRNFF